MKPFSTLLNEFGACPEAKDKHAHQTIQEAWETCTRADWMFWLERKLNMFDKTTSTRIACALARRTLQYVPRGEDRPLKAIEAAEAWINLPSEENKKKAYAAAHAATTYAAAHAATTSAATSAAAYAAAHAAYAASAAATSAATSAAAHAATSVEERKFQADIVRKYFPKITLGNI